MLLPNLRGGSVFHFAGCGVKWHGTPPQRDIEMKLKLTAIAAALFCGSAFAQTGTVQRDVNQQERIEQGLKSGQLTTREAARLEGEEAKVERDQARALRDGTLSPAEKEIGRASCRGRGSI